MPVTERSTPASPAESALKTFRYLIAIEPLGLLYGSTGRFLSPENLVGRSGQHFPPDTPTLSGLFAATHGNAEVQSLYLAGPFWSFRSQPQNFCVPTPFSILARQLPPQDADDETEPEHYAIVQALRWSGQPGAEGEWLDFDGNMPSGKFSSHTWVPLSAWDRLGDRDRWPELKLYGEPWQFVPHLHPRLETEQRKVDIEEGRGGLFLENGVQMHPDTCLVYLANKSLRSGWYRFGGEGHLASVDCQPLSQSTAQLLDRDLGHSFATIAPSVWGSNRLSRRYPTAWEGRVALLTERPEPYRYRMGGKGHVKRLSRGRYTTPAGSVYVLAAPQPAWNHWPNQWFPKEGPHLSRWGCGLALPLPAAFHPTPTN
ncbi:hypothetical protein [Synechococcus sp. PCC 7336]|uniref:hypothetical protein n=1 Tax=Synechococcus sp. PCC 7336 TaxID=195250 RepID=UPI000348F906|nr:hypothetical protein [Synechococcus sp. PCC 7336]